MKKDENVDIGRQKKKKGMRYRETKCNYWSLRQTGWRKIFSRSFFEFKIANHRDKCPLKVSQSHIDKAILHYRRSIKRFLI